MFNNVLIKNLIKNKKSLKKAIHTMAVSGAVLLNNRKVKN